MVTNACLESWKEKGHTADVCDQINAVSSPYNACSAHRAPWWLLQSNAGLYSLHDRLQGKFVEKFYHTSPLPGMSHPQ